MVNLRHGIYESASAELNTLDQGALTWANAVATSVRWWLGPVGGLLVTWAHWGYQVLLEREAFVRIGNLMMMVVMMMTMFLQNNSWFSAGFWYTSEHKKAGAPKSLEVDDSDGFSFSGCVLQVKVRRSERHREGWSSRWVPSLTPKVFWKRSKWCLESWETSQGNPSKHQWDPMDSLTTGNFCGIFVKKTRNMIGTSN